MKGEIILEPMRSFGRLTVYRRKGEMPGYVPRYTVGDTHTGRLLEDFRRMADAERWAKRQPEAWHLP